MFDVGKLQELLEAGYRFTSRKSSCGPGNEGEVPNDGSVPTGHVAAGLARKLIVSEPAPERTIPLMRRALAIGDSCRVLGVHWHKDINASRIIGQQPSQPAR